MKSYCLLQLRGATCAVDLAAVKEVLPALPLALVPLGPECLLGAANLRSEILSIYALEAVLHDELALSDDDPVLRDTSDEDRFLILQHEDFTFGVRVRRVDTVRLPDEAEPLDPNLAEDVLLHPLMEFEGYSFRIIELSHLVERLRLIITECFSG